MIDDSDQIIKMSDLTGFVKTFLNQTFL